MMCSLSHHLTNQEREKDKEREERKVVKYLLFISFVNVLRLRNHALDTWANASFAPIGDRQSEN